ncbi:DUF4333 domain-containing protein [Geodermatophilus sabuli]|uniref:DUF4333 domain-containing protein n=1 Tax=Geodermatophilus sabuli TaxID=1564158 RepID=A0A285EJS6_9ACTN|nr:DUF4333 domain-containing protein [Geodermatophilus sabuli]MBB3087061.1 hypothetical protein [Geodermatophilus sabuli]SNX99392.1 protein of unknown function [Geodermatophilus sabuli]
MSRPGRRPAQLLAVPALLVGLTACSSAIEQGELEGQVATAIEAEFGVAPEVSCPGDLEAEVDATTECTATDPDTDEQIALRITVTSVENRTAQFDIEAVE